MIRTPVAIEQGRDQFGFLQFHIVDASRSVIAIAETRRKAEEIVCALNNHDDLMAVCKAMVAQFKTIDRHFDNFDPEGDLRWSDPETLSKARQLLAERAEHAGESDAD